MHAARKLRSAQRIALLFLTGAYKKTSIEALNVLIGILPHRSNAEKIGKIPQSGLVRKGSTDRR